jgi:hypothetical protein
MDSNFLPHPNHNHGYIEKHALSHNTDICTFYFPPYRQQKIAYPFSIGIGDKSIMIDLLL